MQFHSRDVTPTSSSQKWAYVFSKLFFSFEKPNVA